MEFTEIIQFATPDNALKVIGVLSIIAAVTPTPIDNAVVLFLRKLVDFGAFNFWSAKNDPEVKFPKGK